ncbi:EI24 domain-containing protein [Roseibium alexandrii]|uniref:EI24 domain-containing protein n=1 Tax=Roseibium alexandrii TaxID=388408 RepID=UPI0037538CED
MAIYIKSFFQMFSVAGLDGISRALGWAIVGALVLGMLAAALSAAAISTFAEEYFLHLVFNAAQSIGLVITLIVSTYIFAPTSVLYGLLFQDRVARSIETSDYPQDAPGIRVSGLGPLFRAVLALVGLMVVFIVTALVVVSAGALVGACFFVCVAGALMGRDQFVSIGQRHVSRLEAKRLRKANVWGVLFAGISTALLLLVPVLNLMTPVYSTILMTHLFKKVACASSA